MDTNDLEKTTKGLEQRLDDVEKKYADLQAEKKKLEEEKASLLGGNDSYVPVGNRSNSDEARCLRYFGVRDAKGLLSVNTADPKYKHVPQELKGMVMAFKENVDVARMTHQIFHGGSLDRSNGDIVTPVKGILSGSHFAKQVLAPQLKAFGTGATGEGEEWVPTALSSSYIEEFELNREVAQQFRQISMPTNPYELPVQTDVTQARIQVESCSTGDNLASQNFGTSKIVFDAVKLVEHMCMPEELNEDSAPAILALARGELTEAQGRAYENAILNGDDSGSHMDSDVTAAEDARKSWKGLRKLALDNSATTDFGSAAITKTGLREMRTNMDKFGVNVRDLVWIVSAKGYNQMLDIDEVTTVEKFGPQATILRGALAAFDGIPIVISEFVRDDLNDTGVYDGVTTTESYCVLVNRRRFMWGQRRPIRIRAVMDPTPPGDRWLLASWWRGDFQGHTQSASEASVQLGISIV